MFEARLVQGHILKNIVDSVKDLVNDANLECSEEEISIQCMDSSHVSLVAVSLQAAAFDHYRCDRPLALGVNSGNMAKIMKMMGRDDVVVLKAEDEPDNLTLMFESTKTDTIADFGMLVCLLVFVVDLIIIVFGAEGGHAASSASIAGLFVIKLFTNRSFLRYCTN